MCIHSLIYKCHYLNILSLLANRESPLGLLLLLCSAFLKYLFLELIFLVANVRLNKLYIHCSYVWSFLIYELTLFPCELQIAFQW